MSTRNECFEEGRCGSPLRRVRRWTGDPRADVMLDDLARAAPGAERLELARRLHERLGAACTEYPMYTPARAYPAMDHVLALLGESDDGEVSDDLFERFRQAQRQRGEELDGLALAIEVADLEELAARENGAMLLSGMRLPDAAEALGRHTELSVDEIVSRLLRFEVDPDEVAEWRLKDEAARGRRYRDTWRYDTNSAIAEQLASGIPFESYEVNVEQWSPSPVDYYRELARQEEAARAKADKATVKAAEAMVRAGCQDRRPLLAIARKTARDTLASPISVGDLRDRLMKARGDGEHDDVARVVEVSIEVAREYRDKPFDDAAVAERVDDILARIDGVMVRPDQATAFAAPRSAHPPVVVPAAVTAAAVGDDLAPAAGPREVAIPVDAVRPAVASKPISLGRQREAEMDALTHVSGLVGELVDWITATSMKPNRTLAFAGALAVVGTLAGRNYETETSLRTNIYTIGLAPSAFGKDHVRSCFNILIERACCGEWLGGDEIASGTGMRRRVEAHPAMLYIIDEFGELMRKMGDARSAHHVQIRGLLLRLFEAASDVIRGADYAGEAAKTIHNPNVSVFGLSNPDSYWQSCQGLGAVDGLMARFLTFAVGDTFAPSARPTKKKNDPPQTLIDGLRGLTRSRVGGNMNGRLADGSTASKALTVPFAVGAEDAFFNAKEQWEKAAYAKRGRPEESIYGRVVGNGLKIALILAIGVDPDGPVITTDLFNHGLRISQLCAETTLREISGRLADNDRQREHVDVKRWIAEAGWAGIGRRELLKRVNGRFAERRFDEIIKQLVEGSQEVVSILRATKGRPANRYVAVEHLGADEVA